MKKIRNIGIQAALFALTIITVIPVSILVIFNDYQEHVQNLNAIKKEIYRVSDISVGHVSEIIAGAKQTLLTLSNLEPIKATASEPSNEILQATLKNYRYFTNIGLIDSNANCVASAQPFYRHANYLDRDWYLRTLNNDGFSLSGYIIGKIVKRPIITISKKVDSNNTVKSPPVLFLSLNIVEIQKMVNSIELPQGCILNILDRDGVIIARNPDNAKHAGTLSKAWPSFKMGKRDADGFVETVGVDGEVRLYHFSAVPNTDNGLYIGIGTSKKYFQMVIFKKVIYDSIALLVSLMLSLLLAYWIGNRLFGKQIKYLSDLSINFKDGQTIGEFKSINGTSELSNLITAFKNMHDSISYHTNYLERMVAERTNILEQRNEQLAFEIAERTKTSKALQDSESNYRNLFDSANEAVMIIQNWRIIKFNQATMHILDYFEPDLYGKSIFEFVHEDDKAALLDLFNQAASGATINRANQWKILLKNGKTKWAINNFKKIDWYGKPSLLFLMSDITDRVIAELKFKELNEELEQKVELRTGSLNEALLQLEDANIELKEMNDNILEDARRLQSLNDKLAVSEFELKRAHISKDKFFSIISHDLRNPIGGLRSLLETILFYFNKISYDELKKMLTTALQTAGNSYELLDNLLQWALMQKGAFIFEPKEHRIYEIAEKNINLVKLNAESKQLNLTLDVPEDMVIFGDPNYINTILRNFVSNAIKYTPEHGLITIQAQPRIRMANNRLYDVVSVIDTGTGISEEDLSNLFKPEAMSSTPGTNNEKGSGLGLVLCKEFVEKHQGMIWAEGIVGNGCKFSFALPVVD